MNRRIDGVIYHDLRADAWSARYDRGSFGRRGAFLRARLMPLVKPGSRWLDAGCGSGVLATELSVLGAEVVAVDASPRMIECAIRESSPGAGSVSYGVVNSIEELEGTDGVFDGVLCSSVLEYVGDPHRALMEFSRVLRPGGWLLATVPYRFSVVRAAQKIMRSLTGIVGRPCCTYLEVSRNEYSRASIRRALREAGFAVLKVEVFDPILPRILSKASLGAILAVTARSMGAEERTGAS